MGSFVAPPKHTQRLPITTIELWRSGLQLMVCVCVCVHSGGEREKERGRERERVGERGSETCS